MTPEKLNDLSAMRLAGESTVCMCDDLASLVLAQSQQMKRQQKEIFKLRDENIALRCEIARLKIEGA